MPTAAILADLRIALTVFVSIFSPFVSSFLLLKHHPTNRNLLTQGYEYSRSANPDRKALETTLASLESGGAHALAFASGSATTATVLQSLGFNIHIVSVNDVYGGTSRYDEGGERDPGFRNYFCGSGACG